MLIIKIQNDNTGTEIVGNYRYRVMINDSVIESGSIAGHNRGCGWRVLVAMLLENSIRQQFNTLHQIRKDIGTLTSGISIDSIFPKLPKEADDAD
jgi:hypothetical protein